MMGKRAPQKIINFWFCFFNSLHGKERKTPLMYYYRHVDRTQSGVMQEGPVSIVQVLLHPSPLTLLPSSHCSLDSLVPSPQVRKSAVQVQYVLPAPEDLPASQSAQVEAPAAGAAVFLTNTLAPLWTLSMVAYEPPIEFSP